MKEETILAIETLRQAFLNEEETRDFYRDAAAKVLDAKGQKMFTELSQEEEVHMTIVRKQYESLKAGLGWTVIINFSHLEAVDITPLEFKREEMKRTLHESSSDLDALVIASEMENNSFVYYAEQYRIVTDPLAKSLYGGSLLR